MRTIVLLGAKRSGSTAVFRMFQRHPDVGVCHVDQQIDNWEPNFWNLAADAIEGRPEAFIERFRRSCSFLGGAAPATAADATAMWNAILTELGPIVFDKSPRYLRHEGGLALLENYAATHDVHLIAIVRDPRDVIASQYELWGRDRAHDTPAWREGHWVEMHERLISLQERLDIPVFRYEDLATDPARIGPSMLAHAGLDCPEACLRHLRPTNIGRHQRTTCEELRAWTPGERMLGLMAKYGYAD